jgi:hypothetical protein
MVSFIGGENRITQGKTAHLPQITHKLYHALLYRVHLTMGGIWPHNFNGYMYWCHRYLKIHLSYDYDHDYLPSLSPHPHYNNKIAVHIQWLWGIGINNPHPKR